MSSFTRYFRWAGRGTLVLFLVLFLVIVWGAVVEPRFLLQTNRIQAEIPGLPPAWEGATVALLADFQVGFSLDSPRMARRAVREAIAADPALVLIAGDFVHLPTDEAIAEVTDLMRPFASAGVPVFGVLGNHDYGLMWEADPADLAGAHRLRQALEGAGVRILDNEVVGLAPEGDGSRLWLAGLGSLWAERFRPAALNVLPPHEARIVFMHNAGRYPQLPAHSAPLALAAHTHGGQIRLPALGSEAWLEIAEQEEVVADGWDDENLGAPGNRLYVNRGVGLSTLPMRLLCRPELTLIELHAGRPGGMMAGSPPVR